VTRTVLVALGGLLGSVARYWLAGAVQRLNGTEFPIGTLAVNVLGSFVVGLVMTLSVERGVLSANARTFLTIGFCGGFTTMSTFSYETMALLRDAETGLGLGNVGATLGGCLTGVWLGQIVGRIL
jgi:fluoride exporter